MKKILLALLVLGGLLLSTVTCTDTENANGAGTTPAVSSTDDGAAESDDNGTTSDDDDQKGGLSIDEDGILPAEDFGPLHPVG